MSVIVTNAKSRIAYNVVRSLGRRGIRVCAADFVPHAMSFVSRYANSHFVYPSPFSEPEPFIQCVMAEIERSGAKVLIPVFEETFLFAKHKEAFSQVVSMALPDYEQILIAHNKDRWQPIAECMGIPTPGSYQTEDLQLGRAALSDIRYPVLIKPKQGGGSWGIREAASEAVLARLLAEPDSDGKAWDRFFVQEKIKGHSHCVAMLFSHGRIRAKVGYRQLRDYPITGGQATVRVSERHEEAEDYFQRLLEKLHWHGPCQADFIVDEETGVPYLIDINPRLWGSLAQATASGVDFPYLIYRLALDGDVAPIASFKTDVVTRWLGGDLASLPSRLRNSHAKVRLLREFLFPAEPAALFDDFSLDDPLPALEWGRDAIARAVRFRSVKPVSHDSLEGIWE